MEFANPPPDMSHHHGGGMHFSMPPPSMTANMPAPMRPPPMNEGGGGGGERMERGGGGRGYHHHHHHGGGGGGGAGRPGQPFFRPFVNFARGPGGLPMTQDDFDGKRLRKSVMRKTVDYNAAIIKALQVLAGWFFIFIFHLNYARHFCRLVCGNVTFEIVAPCSPKVFTHRKCCRRQAIRTIRPMR